MNNIEAQLSKILSSNQGERAVHRFLKEHHELVTMAFNKAWNFYTCIPEFELGSEHRTDFLILSAHSGNWNAVFVELKGYNTKLYNKDGTPSKPLRLAQKQIKNWKEWVRVNEPYMRQRFADILDRDNAPAIWPYTISNCHQGYQSGSSEIADIRSYVDYNYHIVIGRNSTLTPEERRCRSTDNTWGGPEIATYDRFVTMAKRVDNANKLSKRD